MSVIAVSIGILLAALLILLSYININSFHLLFPSDLNNNPSLSLMAGSFQGLESLTHLYVLLKYIILYLRIVV